MRKRRQTVSKCPKSATMKKKKKEKMILESGIQIKPLFRFEKCSRQCSEEMGQDFPDMPPFPPYKPTLELPGGLKPSRR